MYVHPSDEYLRNLLKNSKTIAVVGLSDKPDRDSYRVAKYMQEKGYKIIPVNPRVKTILGEHCYSGLRDIPEKVDIVNIFRRSELVPPIIREAIELNPEAIWLQLGIVNEEAFEIAEKAGIGFIMDKCIKVEYERLL